jgi:hypothetical protein
MFDFEHNGVVKAVGYISTSAKGGEWGMQRVNDVRRLPGGHIFDGPIYGADVAMVSDLDRVRATKNMMGKVFDYAQQMSMKVIFALDVDTRSCNPMSIIETMSESCRIKVKDGDVVNPDTPEGYQFYKSQVKSLLSTYPQISTIAIFIRTGGTPWRDIKSDEFPEVWKVEWDSLVQKNPDIENDKFGASNFAISKIVKAYQKAIIELERADVSVWLGSWATNYMKTANIVMPKDVAFCPLDYSIKLGSSDMQKVLAKVGSKRKVIPIVWAHHDDHSYIGKPYPPFEDFNNILIESNASGFGIIHWTMRPLDIYFKSLSEQVWFTSVNEKLNNILNDFNEHAFGAASINLNNYMTEWITNGPMFGRETGDHLVDLGGAKVGGPHENEAEVLRKISNRKLLLDQVDRSKLSDRGKKMFDYFSRMEDFYTSFFQNQQKSIMAFGMLNKGIIDSAKNVLKSVNPEHSIELYVKACSVLEMNRGEKAIVVSMGTRWLPDFINMKQRAGMTGIFYKFAPTPYDERAFPPAIGTNTFFIDEDKIIWKCLGKKELSGVIENPNSYIETTKGISIPLVTIGNNPLPQNKKYIITLQYNASSIANTPKFFLTDGKNRIAIETTMTNVKSKIQYTQTKIEIKNSSNYKLEVVPKNGALKLINVIINPYD